MIKPDPQTLQTLAQIARLHPTFIDWLEGWRQRELDNLPNVLTSHVGVAQGRCQVLTELYKVLKDSPELAAQLRKG